MADENGGHEDLYLSESMATPFPVPTASASSIHALRLDPNANIFAGAFGGLFSLVVGHPFDTIKVRLQTMTVKTLPDKSVSYRPYSGGIDCFSKTVSSEGFLSLYRGMGGMVYLALPRFAIIFYANALGKRIYGSLVGCQTSKGVKREKVDLKETLFAGAFSQLAVVPGTA
jgi:solute carrier family 25 carnitine/acylcarnitine transporter 20/29